MAVCEMICQCEKTEAAANLVVTHDLKLWA